MPPRKRKKHQSTSQTRWMGGTIHCVKCRKKTGSSCITHHTTKRGGSLLKAKCNDCGVTKCRFVKKGSGFLDDIASGLSTAERTVRPYVEAAQPYLQTAATVAPLLI